MAVSSEMNILHYPQLDTVLMVEETIKEHSGEYKKKSALRCFVLVIQYSRYKRNNS